MKRYLDVFDRVAGRVRSSLRKHRLEVVVGTWLDSAVLKVQKREWREDQSGSDPSAVGIFFSVWVEEKGLKKNRAFYNIHALRLRSLSAYSLQSGEFAAAFRARFARQKSLWPEVSVEYGPQTLMQGWIALDEDRFEEEVVRLVHLFVPLVDIIDELLDQRKLRRSTEATRGK